MTQEESVKAGLEKIEAVLAGLYADGAASVEIPEMPEDKTPYDQAHVDEQVAKAKAEQEAIDKEIKEAALADLKAEVEDLGIKLKEKDADALEEMLADKLTSLAQELRDRTVKAPADVKPAPSEEEAPKADEPAPEASAERAAQPAQG